LNVKLPLNVIEFEGESTYYTPFYLAYSFPSEELADADTDLHAGFPYRGRD